METLITKNIDHDNESIWIQSPVLINLSELIIDKSFIARTKLSTQKWILEIVDKSYNNNILIAVSTGHDCNRVESKKIKEILYYQKIIDFEDIYNSKDEKKICEALSQIINIDIPLFIVIVNEFEIKDLDKNNEMKELINKSITDCINNFYFQFQYWINEVIELWKIIWLKELDLQILAKNEIIKLLTRPIVVNNQNQIRNFPLEKSKLLKELFNISDKDFLEMVNERIDYSLKKWCFSDIKAIILFFWLEKEFEGNKELQAWLQNLLIEKSEQIEEYIFHDETFLKKVLMQEFQNK